MKGSATVVSVLNEVKDSLELHPVSIRTQRYEEKDMLAQTRVRQAIVSLRPSTAGRREEFEGKRLASPLLRGRVESQRGSSTIRDWRKKN